MFLSVQYRPEISFIMAIMWQFISEMEKLSMQVPEKQELKSVIIHTDHHYV